MSTPTDEMTLDDALDSAAVENTHADTAHKRKQSEHLDREWESIKLRLELDRQVANSQRQVNEANIQSMRASAEHMEADVEYIRSRRFWTPVLAIASALGTTVLLLIAGIRFINWGFGG